MHTTTSHPRKVPLSPIASHNAAKHKHHNPRANICLILVGLPKPIVFQMLSNIVNLYVFDTAKWVICSHKLMLVVVDYSFKTHFTGMSHSGFQAAKSIMPVVEVYIVNTKHGLILNLVSMRV
jgi:hypothetical protein